VKLTTVLIFFFMEISNSKEYANPQFPIVLYHHVSVLFHASCLLFYFLLCVFCCFVYYLPHNTLAPVSLLRWSVVLFSTFVTIVWFLIRPIVYRGHSNITKCSDPSFATTHPPFLYIVVKLVLPPPTCVVTFW